MQHFTFPNPAMSSSSFPDYYKLLNLSSNATPEEVKQAYRKESLRLVNATPAEKRVATEKFQAVADAYYVLSDAKRRKEYDMLYNTRRDRTDDPTSSSNFFSQFAGMFEGVFADVFEEEALVGEPQDEQAPAVQEQKDEAEVQTEEPPKKAEEQEAEQPPQAEEPKIGEVAQVEVSPEAEEPITEEESRVAEPPKQEEPIVEEPRIEEKPEQAERPEVQGAREEQNAQEARVEEPSSLEESGIEGRKVEGETQVGELPNAGIDVREALGPVGGPQIEKETPSQVGEKILVHEEPLDIEEMPDFKVEAEAEDPVEADEHRGGEPPISETFAVAADPIMEDDRKLGAIVDEGTEDSLAPQEATAGEEIPTSLHELIHGSSDAQVTAQEQNTPGQKELEEAGSTLEEDDATAVSPAVAESGTMEPFSTPSRDDPEVKSALPIPVDPATNEPSAPEEVDPEVIVAETAEKLGVEAGIVEPVPSRAPAPVLEPEALEPPVFEKLDAALEVVKAEENSHELESALEAVSDRPGPNEHTTTAPVLEAANGVIDELDAPVTDKGANDGEAQATAAVGEIDENHSDVPVAAEDPAETSEDATGSVTEDGKVATGDSVSGLSFEPAEETASHILGEGKKPSIEFGEPLASDVPVLNAETVSEEATNVNEEAEVVPIGNVHVEEPVTTGKTEVVELAHAEEAPIVEEKQVKGGVDSQAEEDTADVVAAQLEEKVDAPFEEPLGKEAGGDGADEAVIEETQPVTPSVLVQDIGSTQVTDTAEEHLEKASRSLTPDIPKPSELSVTPPARPWTPSYSVHSQGSPRLPNDTLDSEVSANSLLNEEAEVQDVYEKSHSEEAKVGGQDSTEATDCLPLTAAAGNLSQSTAEPEVSVKEADAPSLVPAVEEVQSSEMDNITAPVPN
ncbi:hypothetical protein NMY22_g11711 [Coprinellus aureogranulatus]|nr:hypothetical protein NMY22_g11711 [Coprinellus aureogranulatus]